MATGLATGTVGCGSTTQTKGSVTAMTTKTTCLMPTWDGPYRMRCSLGTKGRCAYHGEHQPHPDDGRPCNPNPYDDYCHTHGVYMDYPHREERRP